MGTKILVAYASKADSTSEVAEAIGKELGSAGDQVDIHPISEVKNIESYQAVVVGGAIRAGFWLGEAKNFVKRNNAFLSKVPVAYFLVCMTLSKDTPENRATVAKYLEPIRKIVPPVDEGNFAGKMDYSKLGFFARFIAKSVVKVPEGDFRNWELIRQWAKDTYPKIKEKK
jgi:menaquinone-dependent protoporphyrinogen oxidase